VFVTLLAMADYHTSSEQAPEMTPGASIAAGQLVQRKQTLLAAFAACGCVAAASRATGIARQCHYNWLRSDPDYALEWETVRAEAVGLLEDEAKRRAVDGVRRVKFHQGKPITDPETGKAYVEHEYSDVLLIFLLKSWAPETYGDRRTGHRQMNINVVNTAAPAPAEGQRDVGLVPEQRAALGKLREMLADEGLIPTRQRRALAAAKQSETEQSIGHEPIRTDPTTRRVGDPLEVGAGQADA
jgi:hypothetical protein